MGDPEKVRAETVDEDLEIVEPGIVIGWSAKGNLRCDFMGGVSPAGAVLLMQKVMQQLVENANCSRKRSDLVIAGSIPPGLNGRPH